MDSITLAANEDCTSEGFVFEIESLYAYLKRVKDPRKPKGLRYPLEQLILLIMLAKMGGESEPTGISEWIKHREESLIEMLKLPRPRVLHYCTYCRVLKKLDPELFDQVAGEYQRSRVRGMQEIIICIDGKTLRGTIEKGQGRGIHLLAAYLPGSGLVLMQVAVEYKENEIVAAPKVLQALDLEGSIVMGDAMHTQRQLSIQIVEGGGDYLWTVKGNQPRTKWAIEKLSLCTKWSI